MQTKIIDAEKREIVTDFKELYRYRDLFLTLSWRDFRVRYAQTSIGVIMGILKTFDLSLINI
jgi:lipopolysaccharide transport system permease protein